MTEVLRVVHERVGQADQRSGAHRRRRLGALLKMVEDSSISLNAAKNAFAAMCTLGQGRRRRP